MVEYSNPNSTIPIAFTFISLHFTTEVHALWPVYLNPLHGWNLTLLLVNVRFLDSPYCSWPWALWRLGKKKNANQV